jgi:hypothetical protein
LLPHAPCAFLREVLEIVPGEQRSTGEHLLADQLARNLWAAGLTTGQELTDQGRLAAPGAARDDESFVGDYKHR